MSSLNSNLNPKKRDSESLEREEFNWDIPKRNKVDSEKYDWWIPKRNVASPEFEMGGGSDEDGDNFADLFEEGVLSPESGPAFNLGASSVSPNFLESVSPFFDGDDLDWRTSVSFEEGGLPVVLPDNTAPAPAAPVLSAAANGSGSAPISIAPKKFVPIWDAKFTVTIEDEKYVIYRYPEVLYNSYKNFIDEVFEPTESEGRGEWTTQCVKRGIKGTDCEIRVPKARLVEFLTAIEENSRSVGQQRFVQHLFQEAQEKFPELFPPEVVVQEVLPAALSVPGLNLAASDSDKAVMELFDSSFNGEGLAVSADEPEIVLARVMPKKLVSIWNAKFTATIEDEKYVIYRHPEVLYRSYLNFINEVFKPTESQARGEWTSQCVREGRRGTDCEIRVPKARLVEFLTAIEKNSSTEGQKRFAQNLLSEAQKKFPGLFRHEVVVQEVPAAAPVFSTPFVAAAAGASLAECRVSQASAPINPWSYPFFGHPVMPMGSMMPMGPVMWMGPIMRMGPMMSMVSMMPMGSFMPTMRGEYQGNPPGN